MIELLLRRLLNLALDRVLARNRGVSLVQALCRDLTGMVYAHQAGRVPSLGIREAGFVDVFRRVGTGGRAGRCGHGTKEVVGP